MLMNERSVIAVAEESLSRIGKNTIAKRKTHTTGAGKHNAFPVCTYGGRIGVMMSDFLRFRIFSDASSYLTTRKKIRFKYSMKISNLAIQFVFFL